MIVTNAAEADAANERFNHFHDGFLRRISFSQDAELVLLPSPNGDTEQYSAAPTIEFEILHHNYDYPNQPENRIVRVLARYCLEPVENMERFLGSDLFSLRFAGHARGIAGILTHHPEGARVRSMENGTETVLFVAESLVFEEALYDTGPDNE